MVTLLRRFSLLGLVLAYDSGSYYELLKGDGESSGRFEGKPMQA